jgi:hypothetical protein
MQVFILKKENNNLQSEATGKSQANKSLNLWCKGAKSSICTYAESIPLVHKEFQTKIGGTIVILFPQLLLEVQFHP